MAGKGFADIVFCLDASASMAPCFDAVVKNIDKFLDSLNSNRQMQWDWRLEFLAYNATDHYGDAVYHFQTSQLVGAAPVVDELYHVRGESRNFFTKDINMFRNALRDIEVMGDEMPLTALDTCLDMPWRAAQQCHRIVIMMTDETFETALFPEQEHSYVSKLIEKIHKLKVMLFLVAPPSGVYEQLSSADKCEYEVVDGQSDGLRNTDFGEVLTSIGKSISVSVLQQSKPESVKRALFGQDEWSSVSGVEFTGA